MPAAGRHNYRYGHRTPQHRPRCWKRAHCRRNWRGARADRSNDSGAGRIRWRGLQACDRPQEVRGQQRCFGHKYPFSAVTDLTARSRPPRNNVTLMRRPMHEFCEGKYGRGKWVLSISRSRKKGIAPREMDAPALRALDGSNLKCRRLPRLTFRAPRISCLGITPLVIHFCLLPTFK
jgi:hypothetical protein